MSNSEISAEPPSLLDTAPIYQSKANSVSTFGSTIDTTTKSMLSTLEGSGLPLGSFLDATTVLVDRVQISFDCAEKNLTGMANELVKDAQAYSSTDAQLAALFAALDGALPEFAGYEPAPMAMPGQVLPADLRPHQTPQPQHQSWWSSALSFIGHHWQYVAAGVVVVGSVGLDVVTGGAATALTPEEADLTGGLVASGAATDAAGAAATDPAVVSSGATITGADMPEYDAEIEAEMERLGMRTGVASRF